MVTGASMLDTAWGCHLEELLELESQGKKIVDELRR